MSKIYRINLILKGTLATNFGETLKDQRLNDIKEDQKITSEAEMTRIILRQSLEKKDIIFRDKTVSIEKSRGRFVIRFNPSDLKRLKEIGFDPSRDNKVNVTLTQ